MSHGVFGGNDTGLLLSAFIAAYTTIAILTGPTFQESACSNKQILQAVSDLALY